MSENTNTTVDFGNNRKVSKLLLNLSKDYIQPLQSIQNFWDWCYEYVTNPQKIKFYQLTMIGSFQDDIKSTVEDLKASIYDAAELIEYIKKLFDKKIDFKAFDKIVIHSNNSFKTEFGERNIESAFKAFDEQVQVIDKLANHISTYKFSKEFNPTNMDKDDYAKIFHNLVREYRITVESIDVVMLLLREIIKNELKQKYNSHFTMNKETFKFANTTIKLGGYSNIDIWIEKIPSYTLDEKTLEAIKEAKDNTKYIIIQNIISNYFYIREELTKKNERIKKIDEIHGKIYQYASLINASKSNK